MSAWLQGHVAAMRAVAAYVVYRLLALTVPVAAQPRERTLLVVRLDAIGDYVLFRNFLACLRNSKRYEGYAITLVGNVAWKAVAETYDAALVDRFIWIDRKRYKNDVRYRRATLGEIAAQGYDTVIDPAYSREYTDAEIVGKVRAREKIGMSGNTSNMQPWMKRRLDKGFTRLLPGAPGVLFEFLRSKAFFEAVLEQPLDLQRPSLPEPGRLPLLPADYVVLFIGAGAEFRRWPVTAVAKVAAWLQRDGISNIVLCGAPSDRAAADVFARHFQGAFTDLVGRTSLPELIQVLAGARLVLTNETSVGHFAVAAAVPHVVVVSNGNHYGRFSPYPADIAGGYQAVYPPVIEAVRHDTVLLQQRYGGGSDLDISTITPEMVWQAIKKTGFSSAS